MGGIVRDTPISLKMLHPHQWWSWKNLGLQVPWASQKTCVAFSNIIYSQDL